MELTPLLALLHRLAADQTLRLTYSTSFRNPTVLDNYLRLSSPLGGGVSQTFLGNPADKPEHVTSYELGYRKEIHGGYFAISAFYNKEYGLINFQTETFAPSPPFPPGVPLISVSANGRDASAVGVEAETQVRLSARVSGLANYAFQKVKYDDGTPLNISPDHKLNIGVQDQLSSRVDSYMGLHFVDAEIAENVPIAAYTRVDARFGYNLGSRRCPARLSLLCTDLLDSKHLEYSLATPAGVTPQVARSRRTFYLIIDGKF